MVDHRTVAEQRAAVQFAGSELVWEYYPGYGIQLQVLRTFGKGDGPTGRPGRLPGVVQLIAEMIPLAAQRGGGLGMGVLLRLGWRQAAVGQRDVRRAPGSRR